MKNVFLTMWAAVAVIHLPANTLGQEQGERDHSVVVVKEGESESPYSIYPFEHPQGHKKRYFDIGDFTCRSNDDCQNGGTCIMYSGEMEDKSIPSANVVGGYCDCPQGFVATPFCTKIETMTFEGCPLDCKNGGSCFPMDMSSTKPPKEEDSLCYCPFSFTGRLCEEPVTVCNFGFIDNEPVCDNETLCDMFSIPNADNLQFSHCRCPNGDERHEFCHELNYKNALNLSYQYNVYSGPAPGFDLGLALAGLMIVVVAILLFCRCVRRSKDAQDGSATFPLLRDVN